MCYSPVVRSSNTARARMFALCHSGLASRCGAFVFRFDTCGVLVLDITAEVSDVIR
jgi:hypothetical protein